MEHPLREAGGEEVVRETEFDVTDLIEASTLVVGEIDGEAAEVVLELLEAAGTNDRDDGAVPAAQPREREL